MKDKEIGGGGGNQLMFTEVVERGGEGMDTQVRKLLPREDNCGEVVWRRKEAGEVQSTFSEE